MDSLVFVLERGYWVKIEARVVTPNEHVPHGIRYSLTLHDHKKARLIGYDNAHAVNTRKRKFARRSNTWDHRHVLKSVSSYRFENAEKLLADFWNDVDNVLKAGIEEK
jgi:hypothetical protein